MTNKSRSFEWTLCDPEEQPWTRVKVWTKGRVNTQFDVILTRTIVPQPWDVLHNLTVKLWYWSE
jgi:hypothetical protein